MTEFTTPMRVIRSSVNAVDPGVYDEDAFEAARLAGEVVRETYSRDEIGQKQYLITLTAYVDPTGAPRWAVASEDPSEVDVQDTDDLDLANAEYERTVRQLTDGAGVTYDDDGDEVPVHDYSDVPGVSARTSDPVAESPTARSLVIAAGWAAKSDIVRPVYSSSDDAWRVEIADSNPDVHDVREVIEVEDGTEAGARELAALVARERGLTLAD